MNLSSVNVDVLLYLLKFVNPVDRFNLAISGILKGFENINKGINLNERVQYCEAELGPCRYSMCKLEIRSLEIKRLADESLFNILERLAQEGYLKNNKKLIMEFPCSRNPRVFNMICSMKKLETLYLWQTELTLEDLAHVFMSCSKITNLSIWTIEYTMFEKAEDLKNHLRPGLERLRSFELRSSISNDSWPVIQEMLTWIKECAWLVIHNADEKKTSLVIDGSLTLDATLAKSLRFSKFFYVPAEVVKWILSVCLDIHALILSWTLGEPKIFHNEIACLKKLKALDVSADEASELKEVIRSCHQVEILQVRVDCLKLRNLTDLEPTENITDMTLRWYKGRSLKRVLPVLKSWRHLRRLTIQHFSDISVPPYEVLSDFLLEMKHLSHLQIAPNCNHSNHGQLEILRDKVKKLIVPRRPNFKFDINHDISMIYMCKFEN